jgi:hypothetical protein
MPSPTSRTPRVRRTALRCLAAAALAAPAAAAQVAELLRSHVLGHPSEDDQLLDLAVGPGGEVAVARLRVAGGGPSYPTEISAWSSDLVPSWSATLPSTYPPGGGGTLAYDASGALYALSLEGSSPPAASARLARYAPDGTQLWSMSYPAAPGEVTRGWDLAVDAAGRAIVAGSIASPGALPDLLVVAFSPQGAVVWNTRWNSAPPLAHVGTSVALGRGGEVFVGGFAERGFPGPPSSDFVAARLDSVGTLRWVARASQPLPSATRVWSAEVSVAGDRVAVSGDVVPGSGPLHFIGAAAVFDAAGGSVWSAPIPWPSPNGTFQAAARMLEDDGSLRVAGTLQSAPWTPSGDRTVLLRVDPAGVLQQASIWGPAPPGEGSRGGSLQLGSIGETLVGGDFVQQYDSALQPSWTVRLPRFAGRVHAGCRSARIAPSRLVVATHLHAAVMLPVPHDVFLAIVDFGGAPGGTCPPQIDSLGCAPRLAYTGMPSASGGSFVVTVDRLRNQREGLLLHGFSGGAAIPFQGATLCVRPPLRRTPSASSGGSPAPADDCTGSFAIDVNEFARGTLGGNPAPELLVPGTLVHAQHWSRSPGAAPANGLSGGLRFTVLP